MNDYEFWKRLCRRMHHEGRPRERTGPREIQTLIYYILYLFFYQKAVKEKSGPRSKIRYRSILG